MSTLEIDWLSNYTPRLLDRTVNQITVLCKLKGEGIALAYIKPIESEMVWYARW